jgi:acetyl/propionyl-CoA carboxylase alpha subunit
MFKKILIANRGDNAAGVAAQSDFAPAKSAAAKSPCTRSVLGD